MALTSAQLARWKRQTGRQYAAQVGGVMAPPPVKPIRPLRAGAATGGVAGPARDGRTGPVPVSATTPVAQPSPTVTPTPPATPIFDPFADAGYATGLPSLASIKNQSKAAIDKSGSADKLATQEAIRRLLAGRVGEERNLNNSLNSQNLFSSSTAKNALSDLDISYAQRQADINQGLTARDDQRALDLLNVDRDYNQGERGLFSDALARKIAADQAAANAGTLAGAASTDASSTPYRKRVPTPASRPFATSKRRRR